MSIEPVLILSLTPNFSELGSPVTYLGFRQLPHLQTTGIIWDQWVSHFFNPATLCSNYMLCRTGESRAPGLKCKEKGQALQVGSTLSPLPDLLLSRQSLIRLWRTPVKSNGLKILMAPLYLNCNYWSFTVLFFYNFSYMYHILN